jgi:hypothetical protein
MGIHKFGEEYGLLLRIMGIGEEGESEIEYKGKRVRIRIKYSGIERKL